MRNKYPKHHIVVKYSTLLLVKRLKKQNNLKNADEVISYLVSHQLPLINGEDFITLNKISPYNPHKKGGAN